MEHLISYEITAFLIDRQARMLSPRTLEYYDLELRLFAKYTAPLYIEQITPRVIREYLVHLGHHRNPGGVHAAYRALRAWCNWLMGEISSTNFMTAVKPPKVNRDPRLGRPPHHIKSMILSCDTTGSTIGQRDKAILYTLIDTGLRRQEMIDLTIGDIDLRSGQVMVRAGKGDKPRVVYLGAHARRELVRYLRTRLYTSDNAPLWTTFKDTPLSPAGLRQIIRRACVRAGIAQYSCHDFRRSFALEMLRNGCDIFSLMRLMGHTSPIVLHRYLKLLGEDLQAAHHKASPGDRL